jgi:hypothetical protein
VRSSTSTHFYARSTGIPNRRKTDPPQRALPTRDDHQYRQISPVVAGMRLRAGKAGSGKGAARMVTQAIVTARMAGATGTIMVRGDSAYGNSAVVRACAKASAEFSFVLIKNPLVQRTIDSIADDEWTPVKYPGAVRGPDTGSWISDAEVAETTYTAFASTAHPVTDRLPDQRRSIPECTVPGVAVSPVPHQYHTADGHSRCHPSRTCSRGNSVLRPDRRTTPGAHAVRVVRSELGVGSVRCGRP